MVFYFGGDDALRLLRLETFGAGVELPAAEKEARNGLVRLGYEKPWVTDHLGIMAEFELQGHGQDRLVGAERPAPQPYYAFHHDTQKWESQAAATADQQGINDAQRPEITNLALFSWNIDFNLPFAKARMDAALETLRDLTSLESTTAVVIFLQECVKSDLETIAEKDWVRDRFYLTDLPTSAARNWRGSSYGTTTLVDRRMPLVSLFRVHYEQARMHRDALFSDVLVLPGKGGEGLRIRLCNTHLESLIRTPPFRPAQMDLVARYLKDKQVGAGIAAGDFNAIQAFDRTLHAVNRLRDAYLDMGGQEDTEEGYTWGQQARTHARRRYGYSRMDKVYYCTSSDSDSNDVLRLLRFERFGAGVELSATYEEERRQLVEEMGFERPWVTDHLGVMAEFELT
ncbi:hypothetical protein PG993_006179 [Apiospora rasikravindrae]|uniref:Endonuclease/exonuclease/phosphatase domain-containing protein n=1 Tax=Apiospora rasikravindrae TaxID=990691 RepID=A0ABR1T4Z3_9PEZI